MAIPISSNIAAINIQSIIAIIAIASAFSQPVSKKCLTNVNQMNNTIINASIPENNASIAPPIMVSKTTIQIVTVNLALSEPAKSLPAIQSTGDSKIILTIKPITKASRFIAT